MSVWVDGPLPEGVQAAEDVALERHEHTFKRFFSRRRPGLVLGPRVAVYTWTAFSIEPDGLVEVGADCVLVGAQFMCGERITLGERVRVSYNCVIADSDFHPHDTALRHLDTIAISPEGDPTQRPPLETSPVVVGDDVQVGMGSMVLKGVTIGAGAIIEPGSVVTRDVPAGAHVGGSPARAVTP